MRKIAANKTWLATFVPVAVAALVSFAIATGALAAKPPKPPPTTPTYKYVSYPGWDPRGFNNAGQVAERLSPEDPLLPETPAIVIPEDTNGDGLPDQWYRDSNADGLNDLEVNLGLPPPNNGADGNFRGLSEAINDHGQVLTAVWKDIDEWCVVTPRDVNGDGELEWFSPDANGANTLMTPLDFGPKVWIGIGAWLESINNRGQVVGHVGDYGDVAARSFLLDALDTDGDGMADTWFQDANQDGANDLIFDLGIFRESTGQLREPYPRKVNDGGWVVGAQSLGYYDWSDPFVLIPAVDPDTGQTIWNEDSNGDGVNDLIALLPLLVQGPANVLGINSAGVMVGCSTAAGGTRHAVMWRVDAQGLITITDLGLFGSMNRTYACGINDRLQVVGYGVQIDKHGRTLSSSGFIWENGVMKDLRPLLASIST